MGANSKPTSSAMSSASAISPPESESAAALRPVGTCASCETSKAVSINSSSENTWIAPASASAASQASTLPATAPVWAFTASWPLAERPLFSTMTGLPFARARRSAAMKCWGFLICSANTTMVVTAGSSRNASM
ncbi:MAG: hypothetical protein B7X67_18605 [Rhizobiales bacterium 39-66-18]|nr:MAG: hypothetical protein B7X67_18605 [Rhizobiales bacterium 39-66-18]